MSVCFKRRKSSGFVISGPEIKFTGDKKEMIEDIRNALYASKIVSYAQGYTLLRTAAKTYGWNLNYGGIALMWRGGCIIRSTFLGKIKEAYDKNPELTNLLLDPFFKERVEKAQASWRRVAAVALENGIPVPAFTSALCYFDGYRSEDYLQIFYKLSATTLVLIPMRELTSQEASSSILTGQEKVEAPQHQHIPYKISSKSYNNTIWKL